MTLLLGRKPSTGRKDKNGTKPNFSSFLPFFSKESLVDPYQLLSITKQVTFALAVAETAFEFEHRDLHISNILVKPTADEYNLFIISGQEYRVESCGFKVCLIDTTFSRYRTGTDNSLCLL